jgi:hypothetical protein
MQRFRKALRSRRLPAAFGIFLIAYGAVHLMRGELSYENYWGGLVFAPAVILIGIVVVYIGLFRHDRLGRAWRDKKGRPVRFPADDFRKW